MKALRTTLFVLALVILATQTFRHVYVLWLEPRGSVLDRYNTDTEQKILSAKSLDELLTLYDDAHKKAEQERANLPKAPDSIQGVNGVNLEKEPFKSEARLHGAIEDWESKQKDVRELWHFWMAGLVALVLGWLVSIRGDRWIGMGLIIVAFAEMIWATCPSIRGFGSQVEFQRLLLYKLVLSAVSLCLLLTVWYAMQRREPS